jgi:hypothetical protein
MGYGPLTIQAKDEEMVNMLMFIGTRSIFSEGKRAWTRRRLPAAEQDRIRRNEWQRGKLGRPSSLNPMAKAYYAY